MINANGSELRLVIGSHDFKSQTRMAARASHGDHNYMEDAMNARTGRTSIRQNSRGRDSRARTLMLTVLVLVALSLVLAPTGAAAGTPGTHGDHTQLVWSRTMDDTGATVQLVMSDPNGHGLRELTNPGEGVRDVQPKVSPDGRRVVFERDYPDNVKILIVGTNGRGEREVPIECTDPCADPLEPAWTSDGQHIIFTLVVGPFDLVNESARSAVLWTTDLAGKDLTRVSEPGIDGELEDYNASFAPDGYIVYTRVRNADITPAAFRMDRDGTHVRQLTPWEIRADGAQVSPARSGPTRDTVVFETARDGGPLAVATTSAAPPSARDGFPRIRYLTSTTLPNQQNFGPTWSPDGRQIAFGRFESEPTPDTDIWTMRWDGKKPEQVSQSEQFEFSPAWGVGRS